MVNVAKLKGKMVERGLNADKLAESIGMDKTTLYRRLKNSEEFTVGEISKIVAALELDASDTNAIFFENVVA